MAIQERPHVLFYAVLFCINHNVLSWREALPSGLQRDFVTAQLCTFQRTTNTNADWPSVTHQLIVYYSEEK